jgi:uncharacterized RDD family membrane protein YckC
MQNTSLNYCRKCKNKSFDFNLGIICGLNNKKPDFQGICIKYTEDPQAVKTVHDSYERYTQIEGQVDGWTRFANYFIDRIVTTALTFAFGIFLGLSGHSNISTLESYTAAYMIVIFYYTLIEGISGQSIGKLVTGTVVVKENGQKPEFSQIIGRSLCRCIPFEPFSFLGESHSGWHDSITKTKVVKKSALIQNVKESELLDENL